MAATVPGSLMGKAARDISAVRAGIRARRRSGVSRHLLTVAALGSGNAAAFLHGLTLGLIALMVSLVLLDYKIQD